MKLWRVSWAQIVNTKIHEISWDFSCMQKCSLFYNSIYCSCLDNDLAWLKDISQNIVNAFFTISYLYAHNLDFIACLDIYIQIYPRVFQTIIWKNKFTSKLWLIIAWIYRHMNLSKSIANYHLEISLGKTSSHQNFGFRNTCIFDSLETRDNNHKTIDISVYNKP